jgi:IS5 family transposase
LLRFKAGRYAHARQFKRMRRVIKRQSTVLGRLTREIERKASGLSTAVREALDGAPCKARRIADQSRSRKNISGASKLYAWHATGSGVHCQGQEQDTVRVRRESGHCHHLEAQPDRGRTRFHGQPVRRPHAA